MNANVTLIKKQTVAYQTSRNLHMIMLVAHLHTLEYLKIVCAYCNLFLHFALK